MKTILHHSCKLPSATSALHQESRGQLYDEKLIQAKTTRYQNEFVNILEKELMMKMILHSLKN